MSLGQDYLFVWPMEKGNNWRVELGMGSGKDHELGLDLGRQDRFVSE